MSVPRTPRLLALLLLLIAGLAWLGHEVANGRTTQFDRQVRDAIHQHASPPLTRAMMIVSFIGSAYVILPLTIALFVVLWRAGLRHHARLFAFAMAGDVPIEQTLKWAFHRPRPEPFFDYALPVSYSFPSGHAITSLIFCGTLAALLAPRLRNTWSKLLLWVAATLIIAAIGFSRIYLGVHYPTDVIAGYAAGLAWVLGVWSVYSANLPQTL